MPEFTFKKLFLSSHAFGDDRGFLFYGFVFFVQTITDTALLPSTTELASITEHYNF